jgi:hypothetical protein
VSGDAKNLFVSHSYSDDAVLQELKGFVEGVGYVVRTLQHEGLEPIGTAAEACPSDTPSAPYDTPSVPYIDRAETLVVLISPGTRTRSDVDSEIEYAEKQGKRIVGVYVRGGREADLPANFRKYGDALVCWPSALVVEALTGDLKAWLQPDGETPVPELDIERFTCGEPVPE